MNRKIADCVNIRVKTGDFQHIEIVKYAEEVIEYSNDQERIAKEDALTASLVESVMRSLHSIPERIGRGKAEAIEVEQAISKAIPAWLANDPVPNIANGAKKVLNTVSDKQKAEKDKAVATEKAVLQEDSKLSKGSQGDKGDKGDKGGKLSTLDQGKQDKFTQYVKDENIIIDAKEETFDIDNTASNPIEDTGDLFEPDNASVKTETVVKEVKETKKDQPLEGFDIFSGSEDLFGDNK